MISLIQQYPIAAVIIAMMAGAVVGFFAAALCAAAASADRCLEGDVFKAPSP